MIIDHEREKLIQAVIFFAQSVRKLGKVKLFKLLYFLDFEHFRDTGRPVTGLQYNAWEMGPVPTELYYELKDGPADDWAGKVRFGEKTVRGDKTMLTVTPLVPFDKSHFSRRELRLMQGLAQEHRDSDAEQMVEATHLENLPWARVWRKEGARNASIPYDFALRGQDVETMQKVVSERREMLDTLAGPDHSLVRRGNRQRTKAKDHLHLSRGSR